ncbi:hypothetical protein [Pseudarthrobacter sulfonivorans]|uniref:hypothetical protein n=1 Tax=Pseudarthrobacter sulfonivorans TaxID=121292 RepID=UPI002106FEB4|nr:hypothetical protein [Pseudarthrobacter sulfonivorans]
MAKVRSPWHLLRPLFLAGAVTAAWLTLSASAASADSPNESGSLLGGVSSSVSSLAAPLTDVAIPRVEATVPAPAASSAGMLRPVTGNLSHIADELMAAVPVVNTVVPSGTVSAVTVPVAAIADAVGAGLVDAAVPPLVEAVPVLQPVVQPVTDLITGETPLPEVLPGVLVPSDDLSESLGPETAVLQPAVEVAAPTSGNPPADAPTSAAGIPYASAHPAASAAPAYQAASEPELTEDPAPAPVPAPAAPGSAAGGGASPAGSSGAAAWLDDFDLDLPLSGTYPVSGASEHSPSPVSFDPGSSPD